MKDIKFFHSKYTENDTWVEIIQGIKNLGYITHQVIKPHDTAFVLGGFWENPNAFNNPVLFYKEDVPYIHEFMAQILKEYYDILINLTGVTTEEAINYVKTIYETYKNRS